MSIKSERIGGSTYGTRKVRTTMARSGNPLDAAGVANQHLDMAGNPIGWTDRYDGMNYGVNQHPGGKNWNDVIAARRQLINEMRKAGPEGITPAHQARALALKVTPAGWQRALSDLPRPATAPGYGTTQQPAAPPKPAAPYARSADIPGMAPTPTMDPVTAAYKAQADKTLNPIYRQPPPDNTPYPQPTAPLTPQIATDTSESPVQFNTAKQRINPLTGKPFGWNPGDPTPPIAAPGAPQAPTAPAPYKAPPLSLNTATTPTAAQPVTPGSVTAPRKPSWQDATAPIPTGTPNSPFAGSQLTANASAADASQKYHAGQAAGLTKETIKPPSTPPVLLTPNPSTPDNKPDAAAATQAIKPPATPATDSAQGVKPPPPPAAPIMSAYNAPTSTTPNSPVPVKMPSWKTSAPSPAAMPAPTPKPPSTMSPADAKGITSPDQTLKKTVEGGLDDAEEWMKKQKPAGPSFGATQSRQSAGVAPRPYKLPGWLAPPDSLAQKFVNSLGS